MNPTLKTLAARATAPKTNAFGRPVGKPMLTPKEELMARESTRAIFASIQAGR